MKRFSKVFLVGLKMLIINEVDLYLIGHYYKIPYRILNTLYELNQRSYDIYYKLEQKIKQLPKQDFKFVTINEEQVNKALINVSNNISKDVLESSFEWDCYQRIINLILNPII